MGKKVTQCIVCNGKDFSTYSKDLVRCKKCTLVVAKEIPTAKEVADIYQKEYFFGMEYFDYEADRPALERNFKARIRRLPTMVRSDFNVVEIGCAYGYFLNLIKDKVNSSIGFDVTEDGVEFAKNELGINATTEDFMAHKFKPNSIDSVFMWDVVEHLTHPDIYFEKIANILKTGGQVAMTTGNIDAWLPKRRGAEWRMIHPPTHVYYFSPKTLALLLEKYGIKVVSVKHTSVSRNVGSVFNQIISNRRATGKRTAHLELAHKAAQKSRLHKINLPLNTFDIMEVVAKKIK